MFTRLRVTRFRAISDPVEIDLAPLTVLVGENGTGKSSLLQAIALTAQSALTQDRYDLVPQGPWVDLPVASEERGEDRHRVLYHGHDNREVLGVELTSRPSLSEELCRVLAEIASGSLDLASIPDEFAYGWSRHWTVRPSWTHELSIGRDVSWRWGFVDGQNGRTNFVQARAGSVEAAVDVYVSELDRVLAPRVLESIADATRKNEPLDRLRLVMASLVEGLRSLLGRTTFLSTLRGLQLSHRDVGPQVRNVGQHGEQALRLLSNVQSQYTPGYERLRKWAAEFGLPELFAGWAGDANLQVRYAGTAEERFAIDEAATGSSQLLTIAAQLFLSKPGCVHLLEEPENNLHPRFEKLLAEMLADAVEMGQQVILSTHSEVLIAALGNVVRNPEKPLTSDQVAVWHLERGEDGKGPVSAERVEVSDRGNVLGWIKSYVEVERELFEEWVEALPEEG